MKARSEKLLDVLSASYWLIPGVLALAAIVLAALMPLVNGRWLPPVLGFFGSPDSAREILSTIAGSVVTVLSLTFSVTVVVLALASQQFGPRMLHNFLRDRGNQAVIGCLIATFVYCLLILRSISDTPSALPHAAVAVGLLLALVSVAALIYFIHHLVHSVQATHVIAEVAEELGKVIAQEVEAEPRAWEGVDTAARRGQLVAATKEGYVQAVDTDGLVAYAHHHRLVIRLLRRPGDFVFPGQRLAQVEGEASEGLAGAVRDGIIVGNRRTLIQDVEFGFLQLVEIGVRALSPAYNDPFTALSALDRLTAALAVVASRGGVPELVYGDNEDTIRLIIPTRGFSDLAALAYTPIRLSAGHHVVILLHIVRLVGHLLLCVKDEAKRQPLLIEAAQAYQAGLRITVDAPWREQLENAYRPLRHEA